MARKEPPEEYEEEFDDGEGEEEDDASLSQALAEEWGSAPWYVSSVAIHTMIFIILMLIPFGSRQAPPKRVIVTDFAPDEVEEEEEEEEEAEEEEHVINEEEVTENPIFDPDHEVTDHVESDEDMDNEDAYGDPENFTQIDSETRGVPAVMGVGASGGTGGAGKFGHRNGGGRRRARKRGGGGGTKKALMWALRWLKEHQEPDGHWDTAKYAGATTHHGEDSNDVGVSSLALLAFLGAGHSTTFGKYRDTVRRGVNWLITRQRGSGQVGPHVYHSAIGLMALAEAYAMSPGAPDEARLRAAAQRAANWAVQSQNADGSWGYKPNGERSDLSVTGWWVMGIKSAKVAELKVPMSAFQKALQFIERMTASNGMADYMSKNGSRSNKGDRMTPVSLTSLQFLGRPRTDAKVRGCAAKSIDDGVPNAGDFDFYRWYYQALGLFQMGVESNYWKQFNGAMKGTLINTQIKTGSFQDKKGSWDPEDTISGEAWGRVGQTALGALMLEIYFRYKEVHKQTKKLKR